MDKIISFDYFLTNFFNQLLPHNIFFNYLFSFFSLKGVSILIWVFTAIAILIFEERKNPGISKKDKKFFLLFSLSLLLTFLFTDVLLKHIFQRVRPFLTIYSNVLLFKASCPQDFSFPSSHASTAFAAATMLAFFDKKRGWFYYTVAILISYSRIYLGCHYFLDVVAGAFIGYVLSKTIIRLTANS